MVHERLLTQAVAREKQPLAFLVPDCERKHPSEPRDDAVAPLLVTVDDHFDIRLTLEAMPAGFQLGPEHSVVVYLAIHDDVAGARAVRYGLTAAHDIHDRQTAEREARSAPEFHRGVVGPAMGERVPHR